MRKIKVLMVSAEMTPIAKVGGLADVVGALPKALLNLNCEVKIAIPFYGSIDTRKNKVKKIVDTKVEINGKREKIQTWSMFLEKVEVLLIKHKYFSVNTIYTDNKNGQDDFKRFAFFSKAALESIKTMDWQVDIVHCHDWHAALIPVFLKTAYKNDKFFEKTKTLFTIHNLAMQGKANALIVRFCQLTPSFPSITADLSDNEFNFMYQGLVNTAQINTVSPTYAKEILTKEYGAGLDKVLKIRKGDLSGIINGIDVDFFNPENDKLIKYRYTSKELDKKALNKLYLQKELGLPQDRNKPVVGIVSRLVWQKGIELVTEKFAGLDCQFVFLGTGQKETEEHLLKLAKKFPDKFSVQIKFDVGLAQRIYAGSDIFLMPSLFEPCGLGQLIAMRYGTVPVVRATGGLADTVDENVGFSFSKFDSNVLHKTLAQAIKVYSSQPKAWKKLIQNGMKKDFSWQKSAKEYLKLYTKLAKVK
ncbi:MAG: Glycogen synthase [Parcubacteria group bacterium GW2011_GWE2_38_18]|nr:MAG: Glycogen synthase [Parcubacteria group bacterium GW2011_GWE2_38_18]